MSVVFTDSFTVGADVNINAYPATPDWAYNAGATNNLTVNAARDRVETTNTGANWVARCINAAAPTGDQQISATVGLVAIPNARGQLCVRCATNGTANFYLFLMDPSSSNLKIFRCDAGSFTQLAVGGTLPSNGAQTMIFKAVTNGSQVDLTATLNAQTPLTYSDTSASRKTSGPPGISIFASSADTGAYVDDVSIDDLTTGFIPKAILYSFPLIVVAKNILDSRSIDRLLMKKAA